MFCCSCYSTRFPSPVLHVLLHAALQHAAARRRPERRPTVTPISCLEGRKCSVPLLLLLLLLRLHIQSCSAPREVSIETLNSNQPTSVVNRASIGPLSKCNGRRTKTPVALTVAPPPGGGGRRPPGRPASPPITFPVAKSARGRLHVPYPIPEYNCTRTVPNLNPGLYPDTTRGYPTLG